MGEKPQIVLPGKRGFPAHIAGVCYVWKFLR